MTLAVANTEVILPSPDNHNTLHKWKIAVFQDELSGPYLLPSEEQLEIMGTYFYHIYERFILERYHEEVKRYIYRDDLYELHRPYHVFGLNLLFLRLWSGLDPHEMADILLLPKLTLRQIEMGEMTRWDFKKYEDSWDILQRKFGIVDSMLTEMMTEDFYQYLAKAGFSFGSEIVYPTDT